MDGSPHLALRKMSPVQNGQLCQTPISPPDNTLITMPQRYTNLTQSPITFSLAETTLPYFIKQTSPPEERGGANLPIIRVYNLSCLLRICLDWISNTSRYSNHELESQLAAPYGLPPLLHCKLWSTPPHLRQNLLFRDTMIARQGQTQIEPLLKHLPIHENPPFMSTTSPSGLKLWAHQQLKHFAQLFDLHKGNAKLFFQTLDHYELPQHHFLLIHLAVQHVSRLCPNKIQRFQTSILDTLLERQQFKISDIYKPLNTCFSRPLLTTSVASWNSDLNSPEAVSRIISGYNSTCSYVTNEFWREQQFKIMHRAYIPALPPTQQSHKHLCPLCSQEKPSLLHRLWLYPDISSFWKQVEYLALQVTGRPPTKDIFPLLFGYLTAPSTKGPNTCQETGQHNIAWLSTCFMSARRAILKKFSSPSPPSIQDVINNLTSLLDKKNLDAYLSRCNPSPGFKRKWSSFFATTLSTLHIPGSLSPSSTSTGTLLLPAGLHCP